MARLPVGTPRVTRDPGATESVGGADSDARLLLSTLADRGWTVAVAESLTGGLVASALVDIAGASATVRGGIVAYATPLKASLLGVDANLLDAHGPVHPEVARQMAEGVRRALAVGGSPADVGLATTGNAGPVSSDGQPVGTVHIAVSTPDGTTVQSLLLEGSRAHIREQVVSHVIGLALSEVSKLPRAGRNTSCFTGVTFGDSHPSPSPGD